MQSSYVPWKGYFDLVASVDEFILFDDRQFTRRDWRNRNKIKTAQGVQWLTIPVQVKGRYHQRIDETLVRDADWSALHWRMLAGSYGRAACFAELAPVVEGLYSSVAAEAHLSLINRVFIEAIAGLLGIRTGITLSTDYEGVGSKTERLVSLCVAAGASAYLSGPSGQAYIVPEQFEEAGIALEYMDYSGYPEYPQLYPPFEHAVSILDLLFNVGVDHAADFMKAANARTKGPSRRS